MAVYKRLSLAAGGGIVSTKQQAVPAKNTASVLIGLGGTGIDCLRAIKTQVLTRLKPDNPEAIVPTYRHIHFLGVDTDNGYYRYANDNSGLLAALDQSEFFTLANPHVDMALRNKLAIQYRGELDWLCYEEISAARMDNAGASGVRQVGRLMLMDRSDKFICRVEEAIHRASEGLLEPTVNVHIFAGLSGGTGAGCFLDVCYMVRSIAERAGGANIYGYFFLPDVNASKIPLENKYVHSYMPKNSYASLQELDFCMQLQYNGGAFVQEYKGGRRIEWKEAPVDMCHLVSTPHIKEGAVHKAYNYTLSVVAEYVMDFLTHSRNDSFNLTSHLADFKSAVSNADSKKTFGAEMSYITIGAACASIPMREINTYLAAELFHRFAVVRGNVPTEAEVNTLARNALGNSKTLTNSMYESLLDEVRKEAVGDFSTFTGDWRLVAEQGNAKLVENYTDQRAVQSWNIERNAKNLISDRTEQSLLRRIERELRYAMRGARRGPMWAHSMLDAARGHNLINVVDGLIEENAQRWDQEKGSSDLHQQDYDNAKQDFEAHQNAFMGVGCQKRFEAYEWYLRLAVQHQLNLVAYKALDSVLRSLRRQLVERDASYYARLARIMGNLTDTFEENRSTLQVQDTVLETTGGFEEPLVSVAELKDVLDKEVRRVDVPNTLDAFIELLIANEDEWVTEDEWRIARVVNRFFVEYVFPDYANRTITRFLIDKYGTTTDEKLTEYVYRDWISSITSKVCPLFSFNPSVWDESRTSKTAYVSVPVDSAPIKAAAKRMERENELWCVKESDLDDRIYAICSAAAFPLSAFSKLPQYEQSYYSEITAGRHYYEGKPIRGMSFNDWRKLPSPTPQSLIDTSQAPHTLKKAVEAARQLFDDAKECGVLDNEGVIHIPKHDFAHGVDTTVQAAKEFVLSFSSKAQIPQARLLIRRLEAAGKVSFIPSELKLRSNEVRDSKLQLRVLEDNFVYATPLHDQIRTSTQTIKEAKQEAESMVELLKRRIVSFDNSDLDNYFNAVFSGVIKINGFQVSYEREVSGIKSQEVLSTLNRSIYPYCTIPPYQAFLNYAALPAESKASIVDHTNERINLRDDEVAKLAQSLKSEFAENRIHTWTQFARVQTNRLELMEFIGELKSRFESHCLEFGVI